MSLFNKAVLSMIVQITEDFYSDSTHHVGFPLRPFTDLLCIHGYHPTKRPSSIKRPVINALK